VFLWKEWPKDMKVTTLGQAQQNQFSLSGACPHCGNSSVFIAVSSVCNTTEGGFMEARAVMQCQGCLKHILGCAVRPSNGSGQFTYREHFPLGKPDERIAAEIPQNVAEDFKEALRCRFVDAHNATVEMCRRAVQASCIGLKAPSDQKLVKQIDWLAENGIITTPLKDMAHRVRLGGNLGAHPPEDPDDPTAIDIGPEYSDAVVEFTRDFFQHVYVMPERLKKFTFKKTP
jgi:hypothetical protein